MFVDGLQQLYAKAAQGVSGKGGMGSKGKSDPSTLVIVFMAFLCAVLPLDISQLSFAVIGAVLYAALHKADQLAPKKQRISVVVETATPYNVAVRTPKPRAYPTRPATSPMPVTAPNLSPSIQPILAPTFQSKGWEGQIQELLLQITPTSEGDQIVKELARVMQQTIRTCVPEVEVNGFANANFAVGKAFGVAVPEVDIVARASPQVLFARLHGRSAQGSTASELDVKKLQKCAIRTFTDRLVTAGFKFRRSAFRGQEPKVTLLVPSSLGFSSESIPIDFSVNVITPLYNAALLTQCGKMDIRAKELILVVKRWAKDRGICHAPKGHLSPYLWGLLTIYFLQVRDTDDEGPLLPPLDRFEMSESADTSKEPKWMPAETTEPKKSVASLFKEFVHFFESSFDWRNEAVSIRAGRRASPSSKLPLNIIVSDQSTTSQVGPSIEDPCDMAQNLGDGMNANSFARLKEELSRAKGLCDSGDSLSELLEPWVPADLESNEPKHDNEHANGSEEPAAAPTAKVPLSVACKQQQDAGVQDAPWRRAAAEAQAPAVSRPTPPWRRPGAASQSGVA